MAQCSHVNVSQCLCFSRNIGNRLFSPLTCDVQVQYHPVRAQRVGRCSRNLVDADFTVDVLDPVLDGAYVDVRYGGPITKVNRDTRCGAETLRKGKQNPVTHCVASYVCRCPR